MRSTSIKPILIVLAFVVIGLLIYFVLQEPRVKTDLSVGDSHLTMVDTLEPVSFCGKIYQSEQLYLNNINVMQRLAGLSSLEPNTWICQNVARLVKEGRTISVGAKDCKDSFPGSYCVYFEGGFFIIYPKDYSIYTPSPYGKSPFGNLLE